MNDQVLLPAEDKSLREPYREYFITKRQNYLNVVRDLPELWDCFLRLDEIWVRDLDNMKDVTEKERPPLILMFRHSHQQFRIAFELGFSTAITEAWSVMRGSIDTAMVAHKIFREPTLLAVWIRKSEGNTENKAYRAAFKSANLFPAKYGLTELQPFYRDYSEWGTHPGFAAISLHTEVEMMTNAAHWKHTYLEANPKRTAVFLFQMLKACALCEYACFMCFEDRLRLDSNLMDMRLRFDEYKKHTERVITNQILPA